MGYIDIGTKLKAIVDTEATLSAVYNYDVKTYTTYPTATISAGLTLEPILDTVSNQSTVNFIVKVVDQNTDIANMENRMRGICDNLTDKLRKTTLDNTVSRIVLSVKWGWTNDDEPLRAFEINCECIQIKSVI